MQDADVGLQFWKQVISIIVVKGGHVEPFDVERKNATFHSLLLVMLYYTIFVPHVLSVRETVCEL